MNARQVAKLYQKALRRSSEKLMAVAAQKALELSKVERDLALDIINSYVKEARNGDNLNPSRK